MPKFFDFYTLTLAGAQEEQESLLSDYTFRLSVKRTNLTKLSLFAQRVVPEDIQNRTQGTGLVLKHCWVEPGRE